MIRNYKSEYLRDYSDEVYNELIQKINEINNETVSPVTDFFGDIGLFVGKFIGLISLEKSETYYKQMLDMNDITKDKLNKIFHNVRNVNYQYGKKISSLNQRQQSYVAKLNKLSGMIHPNFNMESVETIKSECKVLNKEIKDADKLIHEQYDEELDKAMKKTALKALKGTVGGIVGAGVNVLSMPAKWVATLATGGPTKMTIEAVSDSWGLINSVFSVGSNMGALAAVGIGSGLALITGNSKYKETGLEEAKKYAGAKDMADVLIAECGKNKVTSAVKEVSNAIDTIDTLDDLIDDGKGVIKGEGILPGNPIPEHEILRKKDMLEEYQNGFKHTQWLYNKYEKQKNNASVVKHIYDYAETIFDVNEEGGIQEAIKEKLAEESELISDAKKIINFDETFHFETVN